MDQVTCGRWNNIPPIFQISYYFFNFHVFVIIVVFIGFFSPAESSVIIYNFSQFTARLRRFDKTKHPWDNADDTLNVTGVPPHTIIMSDMKKMIRNWKELEIKKWRSW